MFNLKMSALAAGGAFLLSLLLGLLSSAAVSALFLRALIFALMFFAISAGGYYLVTRFLPELLDTAADKSRRGGDPSGSVVDITLGGPEELGDAVRRPVVPGSGENSGGGDEVGDISGLMDSAGGGDFPSENGGDFPMEGTSSPGLDQKGPNGYTGKDTEEEDPFGELLAPARTEAPVAAGSGKADAPPRKGASSELTGSDDGLTDLDAMADAFDFSEGADEDPGERSSAKKLSISEGKSSKMEGDFNPKDMAAAIRDRLKRE